MSALGEMVKAACMLTCTKSQLHAIESGSTVNPTLRTVASLVIVFGLRPEAIVATAVERGAPEVEKA